MKRRIEYSTLIEITGAVYYFYTPEILQDNSNIYKYLWIESIPVKYCYYTWYINPFIRICHFLYKRFHDIALLAQNYGILMHVYLQIKAHIYFEVPRFEEILSYEWTYVTYEYIYISITISSLFPISNYLYNLLISFIKRNHKF